MYRHQHNSMSTSPEAASTNPPLTDGRICTKEAPEDRSCLQTEVQQQQQREREGSLSEATIADPSTIWKDKVMRDERDESDVLPDANETKDVDGKVQLKDERRQRVRKRHSPHSHSSTSRPQSQTRSQSSQASKEDGGGVEPVSSMISLGFEPCPDLDPDADYADFSPTQSIRAAAASRSSSSLFSATAYNVDEKLQGQHASGTVGSTEMAEIISSSDDDEAPIQEWVPHPDHDHNHHYHQHHYNGAHDLHAVDPGLDLGPRFDSTNPESVERGPKWPYDLVTPESICSRRDCRSWTTRARYSCCCIPNDGSDCAAN
ncbi:hypothetical protein BGZ98_008093 [Dissophora globulifera]|nr:hypothetical protein BGZ98_008093 [Dissophora globulifera]